MVFVCSSDIVLGQDLAWGLQNFTSKKVRLNRPPQSPFALMSSPASSSVVVVLL